MAAAVILTASSPHMRKGAGDSTMHSCGGVGREARGSRHGGNACRCGSQGPLWQAYDLCVDVQLL
jgi:hypothetical protein